jgi:hypothetical protein
MSDFEERVKRYEAMSEEEVLAEHERREQDTLKFVQGEPEWNQTFEYGSVGLTITAHKTKEGCWSYTKCVVTAPGREPIVIPRNYHSFWHLFVDHPNGKKYLLCGHDYQGYDCVNLTDWVRRKYVPREALWGVGFCWANVDFNKETCQLEVYGCYWACPYDDVCFDFSNPDVLPYKEVSREYAPEEEDEDDEEGENKE